MSDERAGGDPAPIPSEGTSAPPDANRVFGQQPPPSPSGPPSGERATLSEADEAKLRSRSRVALILGVGAVIFCVPLPPLGIVMGVVAIVFGALARRIARPARVRAPGAVPGIVLGIVGTVIASLVAMVLLTFWDEWTQAQDCLEGANTRSAQQKCQDTLIKQVNERAGTAG